MNDEIVLIKRVGNVIVPIPQYATPGSAGVDLQAAIENPIKIAPRGLGTQNWELIPTGLSIQLPAGFEAQIRPRSGLALKKGITVLNSPGTVDEDYRGPVGVILINHSNEYFTVNPLDKIAQMIIAPVVQVGFKVVDELSETERGAGGFGHTGK